MGPKDHEIREAISQLRDIARQFHAAGQLRERLAEIVVPLIRAAQAIALDFHHQREFPTEEGDYLLFNQCDGFHVVEARLRDGEFIGFYQHGYAEPLGDDFYVAWAKLPDCSSLYERFADKPVGDKSARTVAILRLSRQWHEIKKPPDHVDAAYQQRRESNPSSAGDSPFKGWYWQAWEGGHHHDFYCRRDDGTWWKRSEPI